MTIEKVSASEIILFRRCQRAWFLQYPMGQKPAQTKEMVESERLHKEAEEWLTHGTLPKSPCIVKSFPIDKFDRNRANFKVEMWLDRIFWGPIRVTGRIDYYKQDKIPLVVDHKFIKDLKYVPPSDTFHDDPQLTLYGLEAWYRGGPENDPDIKGVRVALDAICKTAPYPAIWEERLLTTRELTTAEDKWKKIAQEMNACNELVKARMCPDAPYGAGCKAYSGCAFREQCESSIKGSTFHSFGSTTTTALTREGTTMGLFNPPDATPEGQPPIEQQSKGKALTTLPGIGQTMAERIAERFSIQYAEDLLQRLTEDGAFRLELLSIKGMSEKKLAEITKGAVVECGNESPAPAPPATTTPAPSPAPAPPAATGTVIRNNPFARKPGAVTSAPAATVPAPAPAPPATKTTPFSSESTAHKAVPPYIVCIGCVPQGKTINAIWFEELIEPLIAQACEICEVKNLFATEYRQGEKALAGLLLKHLPDLVAPTQFVIVGDDRVYAEAVSVLRRYARAIIM